MILHIKLDSNLCQERAWGKFLKMVCSNGHRSSTIVVYDISMQTCVAPCSRIIASFAHCCSVFCLVPSLSVWSLFYRCWHKQFPREEGLRCPRMHPLLWWPDSPPATVIPLGSGLRPNCGCSIIGPFQPVCSGPLVLNLLCNRLNTPDIIASPLCPFIHRTCILYFSSW